MSAFREVGRVGEFRDRRGRAVVLDGVKVAIFRVDGRWYAMADACPHMGASLADGEIVDDRCVTCHWHHWRFELATGQSDQRSWARARTYDVRVEGDRVLLRPPDERPAGADDEEDWSIYDPDRYLRRNDD